MGLLDRYHLRLKRPAPSDFDGVAENMREAERWANILPVPAPQIFELAFATVPFVFAKLQSFDFAVAYPNTVIVVDIFANITATVAGGGEASFRGYVDGLPLGTANNRAAFHEAGNHGSPSTGYVATLPLAGRHTLELWGNKLVNAGQFDYHGNLRLWVL